MLDSVFTVLLILWLSTPNVLAGAAVWADQPIYDMRDPLHGGCPWVPNWPSTRTDFGGRGTSVRCWPSSGGVYVAGYVSGVELDFLGLSRFTVSPGSEDGAEEDAFCQRLRKIGAKWFKSEEHYFRWVEGMVPGELDADTELLLGWPESGGVWVLKVTQSDAVRDGVGRLKNAFTMQERCGVIEQLGGRFYGDPKDCPDTKDMV